MKILYAIQATGNGHVSRAIELLPYFKEYAQVDTFLSGSHATMEPGFDVNYRSKGFSFSYQKEGGISLSKTVAQFNPIRLMREIHQFPIAQYDLVVNDFEFITARAAKLKGVPIISLSHQAAFLSSKTPRPEFKNHLGEFILKNYAPAKHSIGFHFSKYDDFITTPIIRNQIKTLEIDQKPHITVYLPSFHVTALASLFENCHATFHCFVPGLKKAAQKQNCLFLPADAHQFLINMANGSGVICGAGFETPAEALYLGKPLLVVPIKGQYEQECNAAALKKMGVFVLPNHEKSQQDVINTWLVNKLAIQIDFPDHVESVVKMALNKAFSNQNQVPISTPVMS